MIKTADQYAKDWIPCTCGEMYLSRNMVAPDCPLHSFDVEVAIKEAMKDTVLLCAERATIKKTGTKRADMPTGSNFRTTEVYVPIYSIDKQSILNVLNEIK